MSAFPFLSAFFLGILTILDPCTLFTSISAIGYIDKEISNRRAVIRKGLLFVLGKLVTYVLLSIPFLAGAQTAGMQRFLASYGEIFLASFMVLCGIFLLIAGRHHHEHDHGISKWLNNVDSENGGFWAFMLGIFFAIAFCPHRLIYFITMIDITIESPAAWSWTLPIIFGLATGLPVMIIAWLISYSVVGIGNLTNKMQRFEKWFRHICAFLFLALGIYMFAHHYLETRDGHHHHYHTMEWLFPSHEHHEHHHGCDHDHH